MKRIKRKGMPALCLLAAIVLLSGCAQKPSGNEQIFSEYTQAIGPTATPTVAAPPIAGGSIFDQNPYDTDLTGDYTADDALNEESAENVEIIDPYAGIDEGNYEESVPNTVYPYAGSTPIPLTPIDAPTPTPRPTLTFTYGIYSAAIGLTCEAPVGWLVDEGQNDKFILTEPDNQVKEGQPCIITLSAVPVTANFSQNNLKTEVKQRLDSIGATNFAEWNPSLTDNRKLLGIQGVYANYTGTLASGVAVGGRIHYVCKDNMLYGLELVYPLGYRNDYLGIYTKIRNTLKAI